MDIGKTKFNINSLEVYTVRLKIKKCFNNFIIEKITNLLKILYKNHRIMIKISPYILLYLSYEYVIHKINNIICFYIRHLLLTIQFLKFRHKESCLSYIISSNRL